MSDGVIHKPDVFRVTWEFAEDDVSFSRDCPSLDAAIAVAAVHFRDVRIFALETQPDGSLMLLSTWSTSWSGRHFAPRLP